MGPGTEDPARFGLSDASYPARAKGSRSARRSVRQAVPREHREVGGRAKRCAGYAVYDPVGQKIGSAEEVFVNRDGEPVYIRVHIGILFIRMVLIPVQFVETDEQTETLALK